MIVEVRAEHVYDDRTRRVGERYDANPVFLPLMTSLGWVALPKAESTAERYFEAAEPEHVVECSDDVTPRRRRKAPPADPS